MYRILFNKWNVVAFVLLVAVFFMGTYWIRMKMNQQSNEVSQSMVAGSARGYQKFMDHYFETYSLTLAKLHYLKYSPRSSQHDHLLQLNSLLETDSTIVAVGVREGQKEWEFRTEDSELPLAALVDEWKAYGSPNIHTQILKERYLLITGRELAYAECMVIDLHRLHQKFIVDNIYTSVYQIVLNDRGACIYHPDIEKVGKKYFLPDFLLVDGHYNDDSFDTLHITQSAYLQLPVYRKYSPLQFNGEEWLVLTVVPGFEIQDMIAEQEQSMMFLFVLFIITLLGILLFGIVHWKREFLLRSSVEQKNLNLLLKHEKQKSETFSIKLELLRSGLNSHFMFNSLGTVKALLSKHDKVARGMLTDLSHLYRYQLRIEGEYMVTLREELTFTQTYVDVINLRMNSSIKMEIINLHDYQDCKVLPISLQLLVENCIKHNIASEHNPLVITIKVMHDRIYVVNELRPKAAIVETSGKGLKNLNARYSLITKQECTFKQENGKFIASMPLVPSTQKID